MVHLATLRSIQYIATWRGLMYVGLLHSQPSSDVILTLWDLTYFVSEKKHPKNYVIVTSHRSEVSKHLLITLLECPL